MYLSSSIRTNTRIYSLDKPIYLPKPKDLTIRDILLGQDKKKEEKK